MRLKNKPYAKEYLEASMYVISKDDKKTQRLFRESKEACHLEIGMGKGDFIIGMAKQYPNIQFIGVEKYASVLVVAARKVEEAQLLNVRLMCLDAREIDEVFEPNTLDTLYINFSDPWPKKRHAKRRLTDAYFLEKYERVLKKDGFLIQKTDNQTLFESSLCSYANYGMQFNDVSLDLHARLSENDVHIMTEYERKFSGLGHTIKYFKGQFSS